MKKETFIPLNMNLRKGQRAYYNKPSDTIKMTPLVRLLAMAYIYEQRLKENPDISQKKFCELAHISPRYLRGILQFNFLSPAIKRKIINGWMPKQTSVQGTLTGKMKMMWGEQEKWCRRNIFTVYEHTLCH